MLPSRLGKYEVRGLLGRGAFCEVFLGWHPVLEAPRALKVPFDQSRQTTERLAREAKAQAQLIHPYICTLFDTDEADGTFFLVMEYAPGGSLRQRLGEGALEPGEAVGLAAQAAEALEFAHQRGIIHRDLKPDNLLLSAEGTIKVADFGLARILKPTEEARTRAGTLPYMAPEHLKGQATFLSDLWSLGVVLYELLAGRCPFEAPSQWELVSRIMEARLEPLGKLRPDLPQGLVSIVEKLLSADPARRIPSAQALTEELRAIERSLLEREPRGAPRPPSGLDVPGASRPSEAPTVVDYDWPQARGSSRRTGSLEASLLLPLQLAWKAEVGSAVLGPVVAARGFVLVGTRSGELVLLDEAWGREVCRINLRGSVASAPAVLEGVAYVGSARGRLAAVDLARAEVLWHKDLEAPLVSSPAASRDHLFVSLMDGRLLKLHREGGALEASFQAEAGFTCPPLLVGELVLVGSRDGRLWALGAEDLGERWRWQAPGRVDGVSAAPEGPILASTFDGTVAALEESSGELLWQAATGSWAPAGPCVEADTVLVLGVDGTLTALDRKDGSLKWRALTAGCHLGGPALAGPLVVVAGSGGLLEVRSLEDGSERWSTHLEAESLGGPTVAGRSLYLGLRDGSVLAFR
jgi:serine/threonine-protein kinase